MLLFFVSVFFVVYVFSNALEDNELFGFVGIGYDIFYGSKSKTVFSRPFFSTGPIDSIVDQELDVEWLESSETCDRGYNLVQIEELEDLVLYLSEYADFGLDASPRRPGLAVFGFSLSDFVNMISTGLSENKRYIISTASCEVYSVEIPTFHDQSPTLDPEYMRVVNELPREYTEETKGSFFEYYRKFGTHVTTKIVVGGRRSVLFEYDEESWVKYQEGQVEGEESEAIGAIATSVYSIGPDYPSADDSEDEKEWNVASVENGVPVRFTLVPIFDLFVNFYDENHFIMPREDKRDCLRAAFDDYIATESSIAPPVQGSVLANNVQGSRRAACDVDGGWIPFGPSDSACLKLIQVKKSWANAIISCKKKNAVLVPIASPLLNDFVWSNFAQERDIWIGISDADLDGDFKLISGEKVQFEEWGKFCPHTEGEKDCVALRAKDGKWVDRKCKEPKWFVCMK